MSESSSLERGSQVRPDVDWIIFYEDGQFTSADGSPWDAPRQGVQVICERNDWVGYRLEHGHDYFYYEPVRGGFLGSDMFGVYDHLIRCPQPLVFFGRMMSNIAWEKLFATIKSQIGPKQGWLTSELRNGKIQK